MDSRSTDRIDEPTVAETPEDVAVLYSWANLHGAKYRDFSASRREYRAQLRHRAAEQVREQALLAKAEAETAAAAADSAARHAAEAARTHRAEDADSAMRRALREAEEAARTATAERVEAARRADAAAVAEAAARREEREIAEAHASAQRQAARYADSEIRRKTSASHQVTPEIPGKIDDPYTLHSLIQPPIHSQPLLRPDQDIAPRVAPAAEPHISDRDRRQYSPAALTQPERGTSHNQPISRRPQGYHPEDAPGVRQIYRGLDYDAFQTEYSSSISARHSARPDSQSSHPTSTFRPIEPVTKSVPPAPLTSSVNESQASFMGQRHDDPPTSAGRPSQSDAATTSTTTPTNSWPPSAERMQPITDPSPGNREPHSGLPSSRPSAIRPVSSRISPAAASPRPLSPFSQALVPSDSTRGRRAQDDFDYQQSQGFPERRTSADDPSNLSAQRPAHPAEPSGPAWLYAPPAAQTQPKPVAPQPTPVQSSVADTLQHSRERVAARWFALKGVFDQPSPDQQE